MARAIPQVTMAGRSPRGFRPGLAAAAPLHRYIFSEIETRRAALEISIALPSPAGDTTAPYFRHLQAVSGKVLNPWALTTNPNTHSRTSQASIVTRAGLRLLHLAAQFSCHPSSS